MCLRVVSQQEIGQMSKDRFRVGRDSLAAWKNVLTYVDISDFESSLSSVIKSEVAIVVYILSKSVFALDNV